MAYREGTTSFIYTVNAETEKATRLTKNKVGEEFSPAFSPDGKRIAYCYRPGDGAHSVIVIANVDGSDQRSWSPADTDDASPVFSPDNKTLVFSRFGFYGSYSPIAQPHAHNWSFYASDLDGKNVRQLTNESFYMASPASVSPDGKSFVIAKEGLETGRNIAIYSLDGAGKAIRSIQPHVPGEADHKDPILAFPNFIPDGTSILFMAASNGKHGFDYDIYKVHLQTGSLERLTTGMGYATDLKVSADGKTAAFLKWRSDWHSTPVDSMVYLLDLTSYKLRPLSITGLGH